MFNDDFDQLNAEPSPIGEWVACIGAIAVMAALLFSLFDW